MEDRENMGTTTTNEPDRLDPAGWDATEVREALELGASGPDPRPADGVGVHGMVIGSTGPFATLAGQRALEAGGSAVDAAVATALAQITLALGSWVSYAGMFSMTHYQAASGEVSTLAAGYGTFAGETDPAGIPAAPQPSGRTALVPGFVAGAHAAHQRFGRLPWDRLWSPARYLAERGVPIGRQTAGFFTARADTLARTPEARAVFALDGSLPRVGDLFRQPALAATLTELADRGPDWMYRGRWAEHFVELVRRDGGHADLADLADYRPRWADPLRGRFAGHELATLPLPDHGGAALLTGLGLVELAGIGDPMTDPDALYWLIQIIRQSAGRQSMAEPTPQHLAELWDRMRFNGSAIVPGPAGPGSHSDYVLAADAEGNITAVCHSINTAIWGTSGIVVDGIPVPDPASFQQHALARLAPGEHLPMPVNPAIVSRAGKPVLASSSVGAGLHPVTVQCLDSVLRLRQDVAAAVARPLVHAEDFILGDSITSAMIQASAGAPMAQAVDHRFDPAILDAVREHGQPVSPHRIDDRTLPRGFWAAITRDPGGAPGYHGARTPFGQGPVRPC